MESHASYFIMQNASVDCPLFCGSALSHPQPPLPPEAPVDPATVAGHAADRLTQPRFDLARPGDELEAAAAVRADPLDHRVAARGEAQLAAVGAADMRARFSGPVRQPGLG